MLVDNGSDDPAALRYFEDLQLKHDNFRVIRDDRPFNFSALNNSAVRQAKGEIIALLNNDIEVITPDWLSEMVGIAVQPGIGAVGARLWYLNNLLQHGGVTLGIGGGRIAGHTHHNLPMGPLWLLWPCDFDSRAFGGDCRLSGGTQEELSSR